MKDVEKLVEYEKLLAEKKREERKEEIWALIMGIFVLTTMSVMYIHFANLAFEFRLEAPNAFILATIITLVIVLFASATIHAFKIVVKKKAEK